jgi:hypothetical protein
MDFADKILTDLMEKIHQLEAEIDKRIAERREQFHYTVERNRVRFDKEVLSKQREFRLGLWRQIVQSPLPIILVSPFIYGLIIPLVLLDLFVGIYQTICFPVYGIEKAKRADFVVIDRHKLAYLNPLEKLNCVYCGYGNGVLSYAREIASRTEFYWCPIKHSRPVATPHSRYTSFIDYGDAEGYRQHQKDIRKRACEKCEGKGDT